MHGFNFDPSYAKSITKSTVLFLYLDAWSTSKSNKEELRKVYTHTHTRALTSRIISGQKRNSSLSVQLLLKIRSCKWGIIFKCYFCSSTVYLIGDLIWMFCMFRLQWHLRRDIPLLRLSRHAKLKMAASNRESLQLQAQVWVDLRLKAAQLITINLQLQLSQL